MIIDYRRSMAAIDDRLEPDPHARPQVIAGRQYPRPILRYWCRWADPSSAMPCAFP